jgi:2-phospho-L-lactate guanylyltransferase
MTARRVWAAVPYKGPVGSKRRLAPLLDEEERARLSLAMLDTVLRALTATEPIERVLLLAPAGAAPSWTEHPRIALVDERPATASLGAEDGLNRALRQAQQHALAGGATALLILPADLPLLRPSHVTKLLQDADGAGVVLATDRSGSGTNALLLAPPDAIVPSFGIKSLARHRDLAQQAGWTQSRAYGVGLALDLDTPDDVAALLSSGRDSHVVRLLRELGVDRRLDGPAPAQARSTTI